MKITTFNPLIFTKDTKPLIELFEGKVKTIPTVVVRDTDTQIMYVMLQVIYGKRACKL